MDKIKEQFLKIYFKLFIKRTDGLYEEEDPNTFGAHILGGKVTKDDLTDKDFKVLDPVLIHQLDSDFCVGESRNYGSQATEQDLEPTYSGAFAFAVSKYWGDINAFGTSILSMCKGAVKYGICIRGLYDYKSRHRNYYANPANIPSEAFDNASLHKAGSYFNIYSQSGFDRFDLFRASLNKYKDKRCVIHTGCDAHAVTIIGQEMRDGELKLVAVDSYGNSNINYRIGRSINGFRYFSRAEANQLVSGYILLDIERSLAELLHQYNGKAVKIKDNADCYLVKNGERHLLEDEKTAWSHNTLLDSPFNVSVITKEDMEKIPKGEKAKFEDGEYQAIVRRILEKFDK